MLEKVIVPLDGSAASEVALGPAAEIAGGCGAETILLYVDDQGDAERRHVFEVYLDTIARRTAESVAQRYGGSPGRVTGVVRQGNPAATILDFAEESQAGLIVIASHGRSGVAPWVVGGTAAKVVQHLGVPTLLVRANQAGGESLFSRVLVPLDGSPAGEAALDRLKEMAVGLKMNVSLLEVVAPGQYVRTIGGLDYVSLPDQVLEKARQDARQYLERMCSSLTGTLASAQCEVRAGDAAREILKFCEENSVSLVAMSSHGHSGIERWMLGSVSHKVLHGGKTALLLVRAAVPE